MIKKYYDIMVDEPTSLEELPEIKPVSIVTIKSKEVIYKNGEPANAIELIHLEENGFEIVSQKDLYEVGDKAVYIIPDYNIPKTSLFDSFHAPGGDEKKCKLGKTGRIRAIKFNFNKADSSDPIYSQGILLPISEVNGYLLTAKPEGNTLTERLDITKYEIPEDNSGGGLNVGKSKPFPSDCYRTDETNINSLKGHIQNKIGFPVWLVATLKVDGSSFTTWYKKGKSGIASRNLAKPLTLRVTVGQRPATFWEKIKKFIGFKLDLNIYDEKENDSDFVRLGKPYLDKLVSYCQERGLNLALRGELNGQNLKGSGNKNNPNAKEEPNIKFFGVDDYTNHTVKLSEEDFDIICLDLGLTRCPVIFKKEFHSLEEIETECNNYFRNNLVEGLVLRMLDSKFSCKYMNPV